MLAADNINVAQNVAFGIIAAMMIFAALCVVTTKNVVHAALWLVVVLSGIAAQYILAAAEFVAVAADCRVNRSSSPKTRMLKSMCRSSRVNLILHMEFVCHVRFSKLRVDFTGRRDKSDINGRAAARDKRAGAQNSDELQQLEFRKRSCCMSPGKLNTKSSQLLNFFRTSGWKSR